MTTEFHITVTETAEDGKSTKSVKMGLVDFISDMYHSLIKTKSVNHDCTAGDRDMIEVTTGEKNVNITLEAPKKGKTITIYIVKVDDGKGVVNVLAPIGKGEFHQLTTQESKQKYISINGNPYRKW